MKRTKIAAIAAALAIVVSSSACGYVTSPSNTKAQTTKNISNEQVTQLENKITEEEFKSSCKEIRYSDLSRNPDSFKQEQYVIKGKVIQVLEDGTNEKLRINVNGISENTIFVSIDLPQSADRILEDDNITIWGECKGSYHYTSILGKEVSIPYIEALYFEIAENTVTIDENGNNVIEIDGLSVTIVNEFTRAIIEKSLIFEGKSVIRVPITIKNNSEETKDLDYYFIDYFAPSGTEIKAYSELFDDGKTVFNKLRPDATISGALYIEDEGSGSYIISFREDINSKPIEVEIDVD